MKANRTKDILVLIPTGDYAERLKLNGVLEYARDKVGARWNLRLCVGGAVRLPSERRFRMGYDGLIAYVQNADDRRQLLKLNVPTVLIEDLLEPKNPPKRPAVTTIICDHAAEGRTAADFFLARHFRNFAFVGTEEKTSWSDLRLKGFRATLRSSGFDCATYSGEPDLGAWLAALPKPCAVFAVRDMRSRQVLDAADEYDIPVPQGIAVLGVDDDEILCTTARPSLSSIPSFDRSLGYAAGRALNALISGRSKGGIIRTRHAKVVCRQSTDTDAIDDPFVGQGLKWIRAHLGDNITPLSIAHGIGYSPTALQRRFVRALGTTVSETVRRLRLSAAKDLLADTSLSVEEIAHMCGFSCTSHLCLRLREAEGVTPLVYRRRGQAVRG